MSLLEQQPRRSFGVDDQPICPQCGDTMHLCQRQLESDPGLSISAL
jgi:hypothetical protein